MSGAPRRSLVKRLLPLAKILVAVLLVGLLLYVVPIKDHLYVPADFRAGTGQELVRHVGTIRDGTATTTQFDADAGTFAIEWRDAVLVAVTDPAGVRLPVDPAATPPNLLPRLEPGIVTTLRNADGLLLAVALALLLTGTLVAAYRWYILLLGADLGTSMSRAFSLTFIGAFFNNIMPGLTGGDVAKAFYIARDHRNRKTEAIITVLLDRVLGITGLALVAALVIPFNVARYGDAAPWIYGLLLGLAAFACLFFSRRVRKALRIDALLARLPFQGVVKKIDQAVFLYRFRHKLVLVSLILSMVVHGIIITAIALIGRGLDIGLDFQAYYAVVPICLIAAALPLAPSGIGVTEAVGVYFFGGLGVKPTEALALWFLYRMEQLAISLIGGVCLAAQKNRASAHDVEAFGENEGDAAA